MLEILQYIFSDFWHWIGTVILLTAIPMPFRFIINNKSNQKSGGDNH